MQLKEVINTEAEFKAVCMAHGEQTLAILNYMLRRNEKNVIHSDLKDADRIIEIKKARNLAELIQEIDNERAPIAPEINY